VLAVWWVMTDPAPRRAWLDPPPRPDQLPASRARSVVRLMRWRGWLRPRRIGCLLVVLIIAALWVLARAVEEGMTDLFKDRPAPVAGSPFDPVAPARPASSGSPTIDRAAQRGKLIVAIQEAPGLAQRSPSSGKYTGFDIALLDLLARDLGVDPAATSFKPLAASSREAALSRGEVDLVLGGYEITAARSAKVDVVGPYLVLPLRLVSSANSPVTDLDSLDQGKVCAPAGSPAAKALTDRGQRPQIRDTLGACVNLLGGPVAAIAGDQVTLSTVLAKAPGTLRVIGEPLGTTEYGIAVALGDHVLRERITAVLQRMIDNGTWTRLYTDYLGRPIPAPPRLR
jgi:glutamate transport system substrate-binding protein